MDNPDEATGTAGWRDDDGRLVAELGAAVRDGQVPASFLRAGKAAFRWRTADAELAAIQRDSWLSHAEPTGLRSAPPATGGRAEPRTLSFAARGLSLEVEIHPDAVRGQVVPAQPGTVRVRDEGGPGTTSPVDEVGWFVIEPAPAGPFRLHVITAAGAAVITEWITARP